MYEHLLFEIKDSIAYITINNPKSLNALNTATLTELNKCLAQLEKRKDARVVIVTGSGAKAFVAGADISEMVNATSEEGRTMALLPLNGDLASAVITLPPRQIAELMAMEADQGPFNLTRYGEFLDSLPEMPWADD